MPHPKKRPKRIPSRYLPPKRVEPPTQDEAPKVVAPKRADELEFEQPLAELNAEPPKPKSPQGIGKARAKKLGKSKISAIKRKLDRMRWNTKKKRAY